MVERDDTLWNKTAQNLSKVSGPVYVWAAGVHTAQLFDRTPLTRNAQIIAIVDNDSQKWGSSQANYDIISPDRFREHHKSEPIVISSYAAETKIAQSLLDVGIPAHQIIRIYS